MSSVNILTDKYIIYIYLYYNTILCKCQAFYGCIVINYD